MKRNDIYKELIKIRDQLQTYLAEDSPINQLMYAIERETEWIKDGKFYKPWNNTK